MAISIQTTNTILIFTYIHLYISTIKYLRTYGCCVVNLRCLYVKEIQKNSKYSFVFIQLYIKLFKRHERKTKSTTILLIIYSNIKLNILLTYLLTQLYVNIFIMIIFIYPTPRTSIMYHE